MPRILTFNDADLWHPNARASVEAAAKRWGCEVVEIRDRLGARDILSAKFRAARFCDDRALMLDTDMVVREDCPSPFDVVPADCFGAVLNFQGDTHDGDHATYQRPSWAKACAMLGVQRPYTADEYINGGFILFSREHEPVFDMLDRRVTDSTGVNEQAAFSIAIAEMPRVYLPREWNRVGPAVWESGPAMTAYVYHFAAYQQWRGREAKFERIAQTVWRMQ